MIRRTEVVVRRRAAYRRHVAVPAVPIRSLRVVRHVRAGIGDIARGIGGSRCRCCVALGRVRPIIVAAASSRCGIVICGFIPLVLAGKPNVGSHVIGDEAGVEGKRVGTRLGVATALAVVQPVGETRGVIPAHVVHRLVAHAAADRVFRAIGRATSEGDAATCIAPHVGVVDAVGICASRVSNIEKLSILRVGDLILADLVCISHRAIKTSRSGIRRISHIANRHVVNGDHSEGGCGERDASQNGETDGGGGEFHGVILNAQVQKA